MKQVAPDALQPALDDATLPQAVSEECARLAEQVARPKHRNQAVARLRQLAGLYPWSVDAQTAYATALNHLGDPAKALELWTAIYLRFPEATKASRQRISCLAKLKRIEEARQLIDALHPAGSADVNVLLDRADLLHLINDVDGVVATFQKCLGIEPENAKVRIRYAARLKQNGRAAEALAVLETAVKGEKVPKGLRNLHDELAVAIGAMRRMAPERLDRGDNTSLIALRCLIQKFASRKPRELAARRLGVTAMVTGSLGAGGAELQLTATAEQLAKARTSGKGIAGIAIDGPLHVVVKSLAKEGNRDFFLPKLLDHDIVVSEIEDMAPVAAADVASEDPEITALLALISPQVIYGLRLVDWFRRENIDIAYIWQDGAAMFAAVAALLADVPRILVNMRGMPPNIRLHRYQPEYDELYGALLEVPGVIFVSNSATAGRAYADWLGCPHDRFLIIRNGLEPTNAEPSARDLQKWAAFERRTEGANRTVGGVFRMEVDKRPLLWLQFAQQYLKSHPDSRFIIVGKGPMMPQVKQLAADLKIKDRILFVGQSRAVGYWLQKFDCFVLLSQFEGMPNVLIEAQMSGVGVVSTPAGSAQETFVEGVTGFTTNDLAAVDFIDLKRKVEQIITWSRNDELLSRVAKQNAFFKFSTEAMIKHSARILSATAIGMSGGTATVTNIAKAARTRKAARTQDGRWANEG